VPDHVRDEWPAWRLVEEGKATLEDVQAKWSINDIADMNAVLDAVHEARAKQAKKDTPRR